MHLAAALAGYQLISREVAPALVSMEFLALPEGLAGGLETGCESIQVSETIAAVHAHLGLPESADLFPGLARRA